ncbi:MAG: hypothetical protein KDA68_14080 [Planctomycetaceae bacterium]|nr:hypothetical protein [Planctomycetaceae bacterium]
MTRRSFRFDIARSLLVPLSLGVILVAGCTPAPDQPANSTSQGKTAPRNAEEYAEQQKAEQCSDLLNSFLGQFANPQVVLNFDSLQSLSLLNQWSRNCREDVASLSSDDVDRLNELVSPEIVKMMRDDLYSSRDIEHLKTAVWMGIIKQHVTSELSDDLERVSALFNYVVRNISLVAEHPEGTPFSVNGILYSGWGTVEDRVWLFSELLKQMRIDSVLISPERPADAEEPLPPRLVAVLLRDEFWLFDPEIGIAVPAQQDKIVPGTSYEIATLSRVLETPAVLDRLSTPDHPYPLNADTLPKAEFSFYGHSSWWAPRLLELSDHFVGPTQSEIFDGLTDVKGRRGLLSRMQDVNGKLPKGTELKFWNYAELQLTGRDNLNSLQQQVITRLVDLYQFPFVREISEKNDSMGTFDDPTNQAAKRRQPQRPNPLKPSGDYYRARGLQVLGDRIESVRVYMNNQRNSRVFLDVDDPAALSNPNFIHIRNSHEQVMSDGAYWIGICKLETTAPDSLRIALDKFNQYVREYPEGMWASSAWYQLAVHAAQQGESSKALEDLAKIPETDPMMPMARWFIRELGGTPGEAAGEKPAATEEKPEEPKTEEKKSESEEKKAEPEEKKTEDEPKSDEDKQPEETPSAEKETPTDPQPKEEAEKEKADDANPETEKQEESQKDEEKPADDPPAEKTDDAPPAEQKS